MSLESLEKESFYYEFHNKFLLKLHLRAKLTCRPHSIISSFHLGHDIVFKINDLNFTDCASRSCVCACMWPSMPSVTIFNTNTITHKLQSGHLSL
jgi:hypothetical protein